MNSLPPNGEEFMDGKPHWNLKAQIRWTLIRNPDHQMDPKIGLGLCFTKNGLGSSPFFFFPTFICFWSFIWLWKLGLITKWSWVQQALFELNLAINTPLLILFMCICLSVNLWRNVNVCSLPLAFGCLYLIFEY